MSTPIDWQPGDPVTRADPYPLFARLRDEDPCHWSPRLRSWVLTRYDDVRDAIADPALSSDRMSPFFAAMPAPERARVADIERYLSRWLVFKDPPEHTRLRRIAGRVFGARALQGMRPQVERIAARLLAALPDRGQIDLVADFAGPLPCLVIMALLGVPDTELARIKRLSDDIALFIGSSRTASAKYDTAEAATREMAGFFGELIAERRRRPAGDAISALASPPPGDEALADDELVATCIMMLFAGHETTTNHIANGMLALTRFPEAMACATSRGTPPQPSRSCCATTGRRARRCASPAPRGRCTAARCRPATASS